MRSVLLGILLLLGGCEAVFSGWSRPSGRGCPDSPCPQDRECRAGECVAPRRGDGGMPRDLSVASDGGAADARAGAPDESGSNTDGSAPLDSAMPSKDGPTEIIDGFLTL